MRYLADELLFPLILSLLFGGALGYLFCPPGQPVYRQKLLQWLVPCFALGVTAAGFSWLDGRAALWLEIVLFLSGAMLIGILAVGLVRQLTGQARIASAPIAPDAASTYTYAAAPAPTAARFAADAPSARVVALKPVETEPSEASAIMAELAEARLAAMSPMAPVWAPVAAKVERAPPPVVPATAAPTVIPAPAAPVEPPPERQFEGARPIGLPGPRNGAPDDLQRVSGIGRQNESRLHGLGVWHFDQIAAWSVAEAKWVGGFLAFPGRIEREGWVAQARLLAGSGGSDTSDSGDGRSTGAEGAKDRTRIERVRQKLI